MREMEKEQHFVDTPLSGQSCSAHGMQIVELGSFGHLRVVEQKPLAALSG